MNFLLHLRLNEIAGLPPPGAIIGDVLRGRLDPALPPLLAASIALHRRVDALSDRHPGLTAIKAGFPAGTRRYAGIVLDMVCDHVAANEWERYGAAGEPLAAFARRMAAGVADDDSWRLAASREPPAPRRFAALLAGYAKAGGIDHALQRIAARLRQPEPMHAAAQDWRTHVPAVENALPGVFADLASAARGLAR